MSKALVSFATGAHEELLEIAWPSFQEFASQHGYDLIRAELSCDRPPSWWKIPILLETLKSYDAALHVDADVVIVDPSDDLPVSGEAWQAMVEHSTNGHRVPNCGVWWLRGCMTPVLERAWEMTEYLHHPWWEQAAIVTLMGYEGAPLGRDIYTQPVRDTELFRRTDFLDAGWNDHVNHEPKPETVRFRHATMHENRAEVMRQWATLAAV